MRRKIARRTRHWLVIDPCACYPIHVLTVYCEKPGQARWWGTAAMMGISIGGLATDADQEMLNQVAESLKVLEIDDAHNARVLKEHMNYVKEVC